MTNKKDLSGIIIGLQNASHLSQISLKCIKNHSISVDGIGNRFNNNNNKNSEEKEFKLTEGVIVDIDVT